MHEETVEYVRSALQASADPEKASKMQAYMKTEMPFYGVAKPLRAPIARELAKKFEPADRPGYEDLVRGLWRQPHREEKYLALDMAIRFRQFVVPASLPMYRMLITEGAWWDLVDEVATHLVRRLVVGFADQTWPEVDTWIESDDMWLRRSAIICQVGAKANTDAGRLFGFCAARAHETGFFIRKAIGWSLREYAKTDPVAVAEFVATHSGDLSGLSRREATKRIAHLLP
jgi:3-methyladenine DNA glycosylase AlkD